MDAPPTRWTVHQVEQWARQVRLSETTIEALVSNQVDGPTLVTLQREELYAELKIQSLPARRYLWEWIERVRSQQASADYNTALTIHKMEIVKLGEEAKLLLSHEGEGRHAPDQASGGNASRTPGIDSAVVNTLWTDAERQRMLIEDHLLAHRLQREWNVGEQSYEDVDLARREADRYRRLEKQCNYDREYALSLVGGNVPARTPTPQSNRVRTLFASCVETCAKHRINVAQALQDGRIQALESWANEKSQKGDAISSEKTIETIPVQQYGEDEEAEYESGIVEHDQLATKEFGVRSLPLIENCSACQEQELSYGFNLACGHAYCTDCMKRLLRAALKDSSLLPLKCCELPIDMQVPTMMLKRKDAEILRVRTAEALAINKMFCPTCNAFINLDALDGSTKLIQCDCGAGLCTRCKTTQHRGLTCQQNRARLSQDDRSALDLAAANGWKQCPQCGILIEFMTGCNHMVCQNCRHDFCFRCLKGWDRRSGLCSSGRCELWDEDRLIQAGRRRVEVEEAARGLILPQHVRELRVEQEMEALRGNEICDHDWQRRNLRYRPGECERCGYELSVYGMICRATCQATVCYTCAHHRIPSRGWR